jgi:hypothetical protein
MIVRPSARLIASSVWHHLDATDAAVPRKRRTSALLSCEYSSLSQWRPGGIPFSGSKSRKTAT